MNQKLILLHSKEQKSSFLDARKSARVTTQSPFFQHCSTEGRHTKLNSKFSFSRHMLQCMHSLSRAIFHKIFHTRQCKIPDYTMNACSNSTKEGASLTFQVLREVILRELSLWHIFQPPPLLPVWKLLVFSCLIFLENRCYYQTGWSNTAQSHQSKDNCLQTHSTHIQKRLSRESEHLENQLRLLVYI